MKSVLVKFMIGVAVLGAFVISPNARKLLRVAANAVENDALALSACMGSTGER